MKHISYPTLEEVDKADYVKLTEWTQLLPPPGHGHIDRPDFTRIFNEEKNILVKIFDRIMFLEGKH